MARGVQAAMEELLREKAALSLRLARAERELAASQQVRLLCTASFVTRGC
jgi:hypothetical protein